MKKKGLIISTIVMVVVLVASLTTATYAWFSQSASASIQDFQIVTKAVDGLSIGSYKVATTETTYYNGQLSLDTDQDWVNESGANGMGQELKFNATGEGPASLIANMMGASGDGTALYTNADPAAALSNKRPTSFAVAAKNVNYLQMDIALQNVSTRTADIYIKEIDVTPTASSKMAGSLRFAVFAQATEPTNAAPFNRSVSTNGKFLYDPYGTIGYDGVATWSTSKADTTTVQYITAISNEGAPTWSGDQHALATDWSGKYITATLTQNTHWTAAGGPTTTELAKTWSDSDTETVLLSNATQGQYVYLSIIVWFDGEDNACIQAFAGGGISISMKFALDEAQG